MWQAELHRRFNEHITITSSSNKHDDTMQTARTSLVAKELDNELKIAKWNLRASIYS